MTWSLVYLPDAEEDFRRLDGSQRMMVRKALAKLQTNPLPAEEGGYGRWLGNHSGTKLAGFLKVKLRGAGLRIVYRLQREGDQILVNIIDFREDSEVYEEAEHRNKKETV